MEDERCLGRAWNNRGRENCRLDFMYEGKSLFFFNAKKRKMYLIDINFHCIVYVSEILYVLRFRSPFLTLFPIYILFATY
jgi:hypothetical protein